MMFRKVYEKTLKNPAREKHAIGGRSEEKQAKTEQEDGDKDGHTTH